jgi:hypothetical protein
MDDYQRCHFSITCRTEDLAVVHCLRALCQHAEQGCLPQIAWGGTSESSWRSSGKSIKLRFTSPSYREAFIREANRLLPLGIWHEIERRDNDPAVRQRARR